MIVAHRNAEARLPNAWLTKTDAESRASRAFWRGVVIGGFVTAILGSVLAVLT